MKKTLAAAITSALVIGVASTTFAAANPFSDVPTDHWSFDAVAKLAHEGVIEGYGDNTFRGDAHITRYEMAQMVAKAMAKSDVSGANKATIDKLAAEYADELNNLGVRVAALEKKTDNVNLTGELRLRFNQEKVNDDKTNTTLGLFRLNAKAQVNEAWTANARFDSELTLNTADKNTTTKVDRAWVEGPLFGAASTLGKIPVYTEQGFVFDDVMSGAQFKWDGKLATTVTAARVNADLFAGNYDAAQGAADFEAIDFKYALSDKTNVDLAYNHVDSEKAFTEKAGNLKDKNDIWTLGFNTKVANNVGLQAIYAKSNLDVEDDNGYAADLMYKGADASDVGSFGLNFGYRKAPVSTVICPTWDGAIGDAKGWEVSANYTIDKNIMASLWYFDGKYVSDTNTDYKHLKGQVEFFF